jgi:leishmanolysin-like peptidase
VCLDEVELKADGTASGNVLQDYMDVTIHEVAHVLGHSSNSYRFFWDPDTGKPRSERPFEPKTVTCVDGQERTLILPDENTMVFATGNDGRIAATIVTPKVAAVARNQFDCPSLAGAQLENKPTRDDSCAGDHWDEALFYPEALTSVISPTSNIMSALTLALMEDSGWYRADYGQSRISPWGLGKGCKFPEGPCLTINDDKQTVVPEYSLGAFCSQGNEKGCSPELTHKLACTVLDYYYLVPQELPPEQYQYFPKEPTTGGPAEADYCPVYGSPYNNKNVGKILHVSREEQNTWRFANDDFLSTLGELDCTNARNNPSLNVYK